MDSWIPQTHYALWVAKHKPSDCDMAFFRRRMAEEWENPPSVHLVTQVRAGEEGRLGDTLDSLAGQCFQGWGLSVIAENPCPDAAFEQMDMIEWRQDDDLQRGLEEVLRETEADWVGFVDPGDRLAPHALYSCVESLLAHPQTRLVYVDDDALDNDGERFDPRFKPDFNLDLLRSTYYLGPFLLVQRRAMQAVAGQMRDYPAAQRYHLALMLLDQEGEPAMGHVPDVLYHRNLMNDCRYSESELETQSKAALQAHLQRNGLDAEVRDGLLSQSFLVEYQHPTVPKVSIIIPTKDRFDLIEPCVTSLLDKTTYPNFEVLVMDNGTTEFDAVRFLEEVDAKDARVRVIPYPHAYNFSAINNYAESLATGDYLVLLNNDTVIIQPNWLDRMMDLGQRQDVGIVGARLFYPDKTLQHGGVILGLNSSADHMHMQLPMDEPGYMGRAQLVQNFSAVTAACLLIRREEYLAVNGLDEDVFAVLFNDVDLCLKVGQRGKKIVWTPYASLVHFGSMSLTSTATPKRTRKHVAERQALLDKWFPLISRDPAFNPNLSLRERLINVEVDVDTSWPRERHDTPRVIAFPFNVGASGYYRVLSPLLKMRTACRVQPAFMPVHDDVLEYEDIRYFLCPFDANILAADPDVVYVHNPVHDQLLDLMETTRANDWAKVVVGFDQLLAEAPVKNLLGKTYYPDIKTRISRALASANRLVVPTQALAEVFAGQCEDVVVVPNTIDSANWDGLAPARGVGEKTRVGWVGTGQNLPDLDLLRAVVEATADEVEWVFFGICPPGLRALVTEFRSAVEASKFPETLASLNLDLAVLPSRSGLYNDTQGNTQILEFGILGCPVICSDRPRFADAPVTRVDDEPDSWIAAIREKVADPAATRDEGDRLRDWVRQGWLLEQHLDLWSDALA